MVEWVLYIDPWIIGLVFDTHSHSWLCVKHGYDKSYDHLLTSDGYLVEQNLVLYEWLWLQNIHGLHSPVEGASGSSNFCASINREVFSVVHQMIVLSHFFQILHFCLGVVCI